MYGRLSVNFLWTYVRARRAAKFLSICISENETYRVAWFVFFLTAVYLDLGIFLANNSCIVLRLSEKLARFSFDPVHPWSGNYLARVRALFLTTISFFPFTEMPWLSL